jgi:FKBP-type peptidyl-prolyl cis-trans isomerase SlyD
MKIDKNKVVTLNYHLTSSEGNEPEELVEQTSAEHPFVFLYGTGSVLADFETNLNGKSKGDKFDFRIKCDNAYGAHDPEYIATIPKTAFMVEGKFDAERVRVGEELPMMDAEGNQLFGFVLEVGEENVSMDFNHPLAGHDLHFSGEVMDVREATAEEISHGHVHGPGGHHH